VAIYLRKSRGDEDSDLEKHRAELIDLCRQNDWAYVEYAEVGTSDSISLRPKMTELMQDIEQRMYDAIVTIHIDRLSRGDEVDRATISKLLARTETLLVTPHRVYDYNNDTDMLLAEFEGMMARMEYKQISRRFRQGKARNAKQGLWSNGVPPFPYVRNPQTGKAEPDEAKLPIYRFMIDKCLEGWSCTDIAWELNKMGVPSPKDGLWSPGVVRRLVRDEVHLGKIVVGKKRKLTASGDIVYKPKEEWIVYNNCHKPVKTQLEHDKILFIINRHINTPKASRSGKNQFSGLIVCAKCNSTMQIQKRTGRTYDSLKSCNHRDPFGERCVNFGGQIETIQQYVLAAIKDKEEKLLEAIKKGLGSDDLNNLHELANAKLVEIKEQEKAIDRIYDFLEKGRYTEEQFDERFGKANAALSKLEEEYQIIKTQLNNTLNARNEDMLISVRDVINIAENIDDPKEVNRAYKSILQNIQWLREEMDTPPKIIVNFL
jgi:DNA invertase Pin-like site-specific DNA recombinase